MKFTPASSEVPTSESTSLVPSLPIASQKPLPPNVIVPRQSSETNKPVLPSGLYRMGIFLSRAARACRGGLRLWGRGLALSTAPCLCPIGPRASVDPALLELRAGAGHRYRTSAEIGLSLPAATGCFGGCGSIHMHLKLL